MIPDHRWMDRAACTRLGDTFADPDSTEGPPRTPGERRWTCAHCPVIDQCRDYALTTAMTGVFVAGVLLPLDPGRARRLLTHHINHSQEAA